MPDQTPQTYANHTRWDPLFHFFVMPVLLITFFGTIWFAIRNFSNFNIHSAWMINIHSAWMIVLSLALVVLGLKARLYSLKTQDRIIRLEERLRLATLLPESGRAKIQQLTEGQLVGLRFASDTEVAALADRAVAQKLKNGEIKKEIKTWRPDYFRV